jgi:hypothetical protein
MCYKSTSKGFLILKILSGIEKKRKQNVYVIMQNGKNQT